MVRVILTRNEKETLDLGRGMGKYLKIGDVVALVGELGSGKTILVKGIARGLKIQDAQYIVNSPSFALIKEYPGKINLFHFDFYRLRTIEEIEELGWEEYLDKEGILVIEWADKMGGLLPQDCLRIELEIVSETKRRIKLISKGERYKGLIQKLKNESLSN